MTLNISYMASVDLPLGFNVREFDRVFELAQGLANPNNGTLEEVSAWRVAINALNGFAYRLKAAKDYSDRFGASIDPATAEDRYIQDHSLFGFAASSLSALECLFMASYGIASLFQLPGFPINTPGNLVQSPEKITDKFVACPSSLRISSITTAITSHPSYQSLRDLRNTLSHRGLLGRQIFFSTSTPIPSTIPTNPKALPAQFDYANKLVPTLTSDCLDWVILSANEFTQGIIVLINTKGKG